MDRRQRQREARDMWHGRLKERVGSNRVAAERLFSEWRKKARQEVARQKTTTQALANQIGKLHNRGDTTGWWRERPVLRQLLADLLELEADEIFGEPSRSLALAFREFPALPPLDRNEAPCRTSRAGSVFDLTYAAVRSNETRRHWLVVRPGAGKSLTIELLRARFPGEVNSRTVSRLVESVAFARQDATQPAVFELEEPDPANDRASLRALEMHPAPVVILAPFEHPDDQIRPWQALGQPRLGRREAWTMSHVTPDPDWIRRMLDWIDARLSLSARDTKLDTNALLTWLEANPSILRAVQSPGDLLALCADFDTYGSEGSPQERSERWLRSIGVRSLPEDAPRTWVAYAASDCVIEMIETHALDREMALEERAFASWSSIVPPSVPSSESALGPDLVVGYLRSAGLLRSSERGVTIYPQWVATALTQRRLGQLVKEGEVTTWGAVAGDSSRQSLIDDALSALAPGELHTAAEALVAGLKSGVTTFAEVAALEAIVAALARRLATNVPTPRDADLAKRALVLQLDCLVSGSNVGPSRMPTSRRDRDEWFLTGWAISLATPGTNVAVPADLRWVLPGWAHRLLLSEADRHYFPWSSVQPWGATHAVQALARLAPKAVTRLAATPIPKDVPRLLVPALILAEEWHVSHEQFSALAGTWEETLLADALEGVDGRRRQSLASLLWQFASETREGENAAPVAERLVYLKNHHSPLLGFVVSNIPETVIEETARSAGTHRRRSSGNSYVTSDPGALQYLSSEHRAAAVRARLSTPVEFDEVRELVQVLEGDDLDVLLDVVRMADRNVAAEFATRVWSVLPERAEQEARRAFDDRLAAAEAWFRTAPRAQLGMLLEAVEASSSQPPWIRDWALAKLLDAGVNAERLFRLTRTESLAQPTASSARKTSKGATKS